MVLRVNTFFNNLLAKTGGWYVIIGVAISQLTGIPGIILGVASIQLNAGFNEKQIRALIIIAPILLLITDLILLAVAMAFSKTARERLDKIIKLRKLDDTKLEQKTAWSQITSFTWRYGLASAIVAFILVVLVATAYLYFFADINFDQVIYSLMGGVVAVVSTVLLATLFLERILIPTRIALVPAEFELQLAGRSGPLLNIKFQALVSLLILVGILMIGPIGYHQTVTVLYEEVGSQQVLLDLQVRSIIVSVVILLLGLALSLIISRSISDPTKNLIETFSKVEQGDLSQRASVTASDEIAELTIYFNRMIARLEELQGSLEKQVRERTAQLNAISKVGRAATSILDPDKIIAQVVNLIAQELGYYHAAFYLIDTRSQRAELKDATGDAGRVLKESKHHIELNSRHIISEAIRSQSAQVALDTGEKSIRFNNPLLPYTRSEIALPLVIGDRVLGALDVHSTKPSAFGEQDIETLQNMASQVAVALENARLFQETGRNLEEMRSIQRQYLQKAWSVEVLPAEGREYSVGNEPNPESGSTLQVPLALRDQVIGQIKIENDAVLGPEEQSLVEAISIQAALALENARLLEDSQNIASREILVSTITNKIWNSTTLDGILQTSIRELGRILDATEATIELDMEQ